MPMIFEYAGEEYKKPIVLEVRSFNKRAIKVYEKFGFNKIGALRKEVFLKNEEFYNYEKWFLFFYTQTYGNCI